MKIVECFWKKKKYIIKKRGPSQAWSNVGGVVRAIPPITRPRPGFSSCPYIITLSYHLHIVLVSSWYFTRLPYIICISPAYLFHINLTSTSLNCPTISTLIIITSAYHTLHIFIYYLILLPDLQTSQWQHLFCATSVASVGNSVKGKSDTTMDTISDKPKRLIDLLRNNSFKMYDLRQFCLGSRLF